LSERYALRNQSNAIVPLSDDRPETQKICDCILTLPHLRGTVSRLTCPLYWSSQYAGLEHLFQWISKSRTEPALSRPSGGLIMPSTASPNKRKRNRVSFNAQAFATGILSDLRFNRNDHIVTICVPSHDRNSQPLPDGAQARWATEAMEKLADLFQGATALQSHKGIYKSRRRGYLWDDTILIQSFARKSEIENVQTLLALVAFARDMRRKLSQEAVLLTFDNILRFITA